MAIPAEAALASKRKRTYSTSNPQNDWTNKDWKPGSGNLLYPSHLVDSDGDLHDAIYEITFFFLYGWVPERYTVDVDAEFKDLELRMRYKFPEMEDKSQKGLKHMAMMWREHFKKELCSIISRTIDSDTNYRHANSARSNQSEIKIANMRPSLIASKGPHASKMTRTLCTPVSLGGFRVHTLELIDLVLFNVAKYLNWYEENPDLGPKTLSAQRRRTGGAETLAVLVPRNRQVNTIKAENQAYYSAPMHTALRRNNNESTLLERAMEQTRRFWKPQTWTIRVIGDSAEKHEQIVCTSMSRWKNAMTPYELLVILMGKRRLRKLLRGMDNGLLTPIRYFSTQPLKDDGTPNSDLQSLPPDTIAVWRNTFGELSTMQVEDTNTNSKVPAVHLCNGMYTPWDFETHPKLPLPSGSLRTRFRYGWYEEQLLKNNTTYEHKPREYPLMHRNGRTYFVDTYPSLPETMRHVYPELKKKSRY